MAPADSPAITDLRIPVGDGAEVSAVLMRPAGATTLFVFGHGAGAGMHHVFMETTAVRLASRRIATLRYQFPYMEQGSRRPGPRPLLLSTVRSAVAAAERAAGDLQIVAGGKSMGGRMTSMALAEGPADDVRGLVFIGFPLHPAGRPATTRAEHLGKVAVPMLFLQGTRDKLGGLDLLRPVCRDLGDRATLHVVEGADHGFAVLKRSGRTPDDVLDELAVTIEVWTEALRIGTCPRASRARARPPSKP